MTVDLILMIIAFLLLAGVSAASVRQLIRGTAPERPRLPLLWLAVLCLAAVLLLRGFRMGRIPAFGVFEALVWYAFAVTVAYISLAARHETRGVCGFLLPFVTVVVAGSLPAIATPVVVEPGIQSAWLGLHIATAFLGYGFFTLESVLALAYLVQDGNLKRKSFGALFQRLPSLEALDHLMREQISVAFVLFSFSLAMGVVLAHQRNWGAAWVTDPKVAGAAATWLVYALLFHLRLAADRHGRRMAQVALAGLACVLVTFFGVHLLTSSLHEFIFTK